MPDDRVWAELAEAREKLDRIRTSVQELRAPGEMLGSEETTPHPECERICSELIATVLEHILGDCDPEQCPSDEHGGSG